MQENKTHWRRHDFRVNSLHLIIDGLRNSIAELQKKVNEVHWYDGDWLLEETEPIYGLAMIAFQNYIIGSISDFEGDTKNKHAYYRQDKKLGNFSNTTIELIVTLANYAKHQNEGLPFSGTKTILQNFNLTYQDLTYLDDSAIFQGLTY